MKKAIFSLIAVLIYFALATTETKAQAQIMPTANKIIYSTNSVEIQDSTGSRKSFTFKKGTLYVQASGTGTGSSVTLYEAHTLRTVYKGKVAQLRIVGVANSDSLKIVSLKTTPY